MIEWLCTFQPGQAREPVLVGAPASEVEVVWDGARDEFASGTGRDREKSQSRNLDREHQAQSRLAGGQRG